MKPELEFPLYAVHRYTNCIFKFESYNRCSLVANVAHEYATGDSTNKLIEPDNTDYWRILNKLQAKALEAKLNKENNNE